MCFDVLSSSHHTTEPDFRSLAYICMSHVVKYKLINFSNLVILVRYRSEVYMYGYILHKRVLAMELNLYPMNFIT